MLQDDAAVRFLHVGMLQHDPAGRMAFLHRTAEGKFLPQRDSFRRFHLLTVPLSPTRAAALLGGLHKHMGYEAFQVCPPFAAHHQGLFVQRIADVLMSTECGCLKDIDIEHANLSARSCLDDAQC